MVKRVVIDGSNLFYAAEKSFVALQNAITQIKVLGEINLRIYVDATLRHEIKKADIPSFEEMIATGLLQQVPSGTKADDWILHWATENNAIVVSNDEFKDNPDQSDKFKKSQRLCGAVYDGQSDIWTFLERFQYDGPAKDLATLLTLQEDTSQPRFSDPPIGSYSARVTSANPACLVILVDQSQSMGHLAVGTAKSKAQVVADCVNTLIEELVLTSTKGFGDPKPYFYLSIIGYGHSEKAQLMFLLRGTNNQTPFMAIDLVNQNAEVIDGQPIWIKPHFGSLTPMCAAFVLACRLSSDWSKSHQNSHPPMVINVTDGAPTDGNPSKEVANISQVSTLDGNTLVFNAHIASEKSARSKKTKILKLVSDSPINKVSYPSSDANLIDDLAKQLFSVSSALPESIIKRAQALNIEISTGARAFVYNGGPDDLVKFFKLGTPARQ